MKKDEVPQDSESLYPGQRKLLYAVDSDGRYVGVHSSGWEVESAATRAAIAEINKARDKAWERAKQGISSPLEFHMYNCRMDVALLAQASGLGKWRVRRHLRAKIFAKLPARILNRYSEALGIPPSELQALPEKPFD